MSGLTVQTGKSSPTKPPSRPHLPSGQSAATSRSSSPQRPTYSPISPARSPTRASNTSVQEPPPLPPPQRAQPQPQPQPQPQALRTYTHNAPNTEFIPPPPPEPITLEDNVDAIALRSAITILQLQKKKAAEDIKTLQKIKQQASVDPEGFRDTLVAEQMRSKPDPLFAPQDLYSKEEEEEEGEDEEDADMTGAQETEKWRDFPARQNVVRCPPINWNQYGVVGESLDKLHRDQQRRPTTGAPQKIGADGRVTAVESVRRQEARIAAPYTPGKDKIEKNTKKGKK